MKKGDKATFVADVFLGPSEDLGDKIAENIRLEGVVLDITDEYALILLSPGMLQMVPLKEQLKTKKETNF